MTIDYQVTPDDILNYNIFTYFKRAGGRKKISKARIIHGVICIVCFILGFMLKQYEMISSMLFWISALTFSAGMFLLLYIPLVLKPMVNRHIKKSDFKKAMAPHQIVINPESYVIQSQFCETKTFWKEVESIYITNEYAYILIAKNTGYIIPKRSFPDQQAWDEFTTLLQTYSNKTMLINE